MQTTFFKVVWTMRQYLNPLLCSFMRSQIINTKWRVFNSLCCGHSGSLLFPFFLRIGRNASCSFEIFLGRGIFFFFSWAKTPPKKVPFFVLSPSIYMRGSHFSSSFFFPYDGFFRHHYSLLLQRLLFTICRVVTTLEWFALSLTLI